MEEENDPLEVSNPDEVSEPITEDAEDSELLKAQELAKNYKIRAEKAEATAKQLKIKPEEKETPKEETLKSNELSVSDFRALADVHDDDYEEVVEFAKFKGISITEAKKTPTIQSLLREKEETRKTAETTNTGMGKRGTSKATDESLVRDAEKGKLPESDSEIERLMHAKLHGKKD